MVRDALLTALPVRGGVSRSS